MLASPGSEPVRKTEKIRFVDGVQHLDRGPLDDLVLQHRHSERSLPPVGLGDIHPTHRLRSVRSSLQPFGKVLEIPLQFFPVVPPRLHEKEAVGASELEQFAAIAIATNEI